METINDLKKKFEGYSTTDFLNVIVSMQSTIHNLKTLLFDSKSERKRQKEDPVGMKPLFDEIESIIEEENKLEPEENSGTQIDGQKGKKKQRGKRKPLPRDLPRERIEYDLEENKKICSIHQVPLVRIGENISEQLEIIPAQVKVIDNVTFTYKCPCCSIDGEQENFIKSKEEPRPIPKSFASPSLLAYIATAKYQDALPLYRQESIFARCGIDLCRTTMARWMIQSASLATPILNLMKDDLIDHNVVGCDETPVQVLDEPNRKPEQKSYMWVVTTLVDAPIILFNYYTGRGAAVAKEIFTDFEGTIVCDGLKSYDAFSRKRNIVLAACMAHIRRKFYQAEKAAKKADPKSRPKSSIILGFIRELYKIEASIKGKPPNEILSARQTKSKLIMNKFRKWLENERNTVLPKSLLGKAISYAIDQWAKMEVFLDNPWVTIDNNPTERCIRPFVIGRNNWMFSQSVAGAEASATLYSLIESAKANGIEPHSYLTLIFKELPHATKVEDYERLMPHKVKNFFELKAYRVAS